MSMFHELMMKKKGMPSRYQEVEYIESTTTQYIDTGVYLTGNSRVKIKAQSSYTETGIRIFGSEYTNEIFRFGTSKNVNDFRWYSGYYNSYLANANFNYDQTVFEVDFDKNNVYVNNELVNSHTYHDFTATHTAYLFTINTSSMTIRPMRIYYCQIYDNGTLVRNYIPVYDTLTQKYGMWESVQGKFYGNDGTGDFKGSIVGYTIVGSPTITDGVVSGFTTNDYVENTSFPTNVDFSGKIRAKINAEASGWNGVFYIRKMTSPNNMFSVEINNTNVVRIYRFDESSNSNLSEGIYNLVLADVWVDYVFDYNKTTKILNVSAIKVLDNSTIFTKTYNGVVLDGGTLKLGFVFNAFNGSIDMNETYIKINNKLWFNGQPS